MAQIVGTIGIPHNPNAPAQVAKEGPESETARLYARVAADLAALQPDLLVMFDTDHLNTFFLDNLPVFAIGVDEGFSGPNDDVPGMPAYTVPSNPRFAAHLHAQAVQAGFDLASVQQFQVDHSVLVPLHFLNPGMRIPVVPVFVNGHVPPLPSARRCLALGAAVGKATQGFPEPLRVVVIGSGSFSLDVHGTRTAPGQASGVPDPKWAARIQAHLERGATDVLVDESTQDRMLAAGNVGGELLNWIAMLGAVNSHKLQWMTPQPTRGHAFAVWI
jgi:aromatic ring-opening dioxygenase catalytic subunit (LigB family)